MGSCFSGIGGLELGLEWTGGFETRWQIEVDPYASAVLAKHWPDVKRYADIRTVTELDGVDVICGGFPCQDVSRAGTRAGISGERSGLYRELLRVVGLVRPRYVIMENVAALLGDGMGTVIGDLAEAGYDAEWDLVSACEFGAPHTRERVFIVAYPRGESRPLQVFDWDGREEKGRHQVAKEWGKNRLVDQMGRKADRGIQGNAEWLPAPEPPWMAHGFPEELGQIRCYGNAVVPQVAQKIGQMILDWESRHEI